jgi:general secretion pathway protein D
MGGGMGGGGGLRNVTTPTLTQNVQDLVRQFFQAATGISFGTVTTGQGGQQGLGAGTAGRFGAGGAGGAAGAANAAGTAARTMFFNDRLGRLHVRATLQELDIIDQAIQTLNEAPPQVTIEVKFVEIGQEDNKALGFDWNLGNVNMLGGKMGASGGSYPSVVTPPRLGNPTGIFPGGGGPGTVFPAASDGNLTAGLRNDNVGPAVGTLTGILTDPQFRMVIRALEQRTGVEVMSAPKVTTMSGRQAQVQVNTLRTIAVGVNIQQQAAPTAAVGTGTQITQPQQGLQPSTISMPTGPTLDVIPSVSADEYTIQMTLIPSIVDFLGYGNPDIGEAAIFEASLQAQQGTIRSPVPLPRFQVRQITTSAIVWDGQTIVLGGLISDDVRRQRDKVPILGDIPLLGRFFRSEKNTTAKKNLVVFVTPTIIDPAGNRVHTEDNLPYDPNTIPPQIQKPVK